uniref:Uncharacterized protein n=1 Tax=Sphaerodactylus townsendi TaxID=933632 RepID=A0ACB8EZQ6_9SAUR
MAPERGSDGRPQLPEDSPCSTEGLPKAFLQSLRTLFDILDDRRRGYVHLREIESRWLQQGPEARELPRGVLEGLRRAAPASGYLTFERFVLGLRASLLSSDKRSSPAIVANGKVPGLREEGKVAEKGLERGGSASRSLEKIPNSRVEPIQCKREALACCPSTGGDAGWQLPQKENASKGLGEARRQQRGRCGHRRHTLTNGVDYGMLSPFSAERIHPCAQCIIGKGTPSGYPQNYGTPFRLTLAQVQDWSFSQLHFEVSVGIDSLAGPD